MGRIVGRGERRSEVLQNPVMGEISRLLYLVDVLVWQQVSNGRVGFLICPPVDGVLKGAAFGMGLRIVELIPDLLEQ